jgi:mannose-6-phosphate isomerase
MTISYPLLFSPILVEKPWGGGRLSRYGRASSGTTLIGESWDLVDMDTTDTTVDHPRSIVSNGPYAGQELRTVAAGDAGPLILGDLTNQVRESGFPLLVKLLDAGRALSVQLHPPRSISARSFKTETWIVMEAPEDGVVYLGVRPEITEAQVMASLGTSSIEEMLQPVPVVAGSVVHVEAGAIHALGPDVLVLEVQTRSDVTYRLWDWPRDGAPSRELHLGPAAEVIREVWPVAPEPRISPKAQGRLVTTDDYAIDRYFAPPTALLPVWDCDRAVVMSITAGHVEFTCGEAATIVPTGTTALIPPDCPVELRSGADGATVIITRVRSEHDRLPSQAPVTNPGGA